MSKYDNKTKKELQTAIQSRNAKRKKGKNSDGYIAFGGNIATLKSRLIKDDKQRNKDAKKQRKRKEPEEPRVTPPKLKNQKKKLKKAPKKAAKKFVPPKVQPKKAVFPKGKYLDKMRIPSPFDMEYKRFCSSPPPHPYSSHLCLCTVSLRICSKSSLLSWMMEMSSLSAYVSCTNSSFLNSKKN